MTYIRFYLILGFTISILTQSAMGAIRQIADSKDIQIFWADPGEASKCRSHPAKDSTYSDFRKKEVAQRLEKIVRPPLQKLVNWSRHRFNLSTFLPIKIILNSEDQIYCSLATTNSFSYVDLQGQNVNQDFTGQVWIGADLPSDDRVVSQITIHEIGHVFIRAIRGNIGTVSDEPFADFIALVTHNNNPYFASQYPKMESTYFEQFSPVQQKWIQSIETPKAWRDFSKNYRHENSLRMFIDGHLMSPVINSILYRLGRRISLEKLFHAFTSVLVETQAGRGSSTLNLLDAITARLNLTIVERTFLNIMKVQNNWVQEGSPYALSTEVRSGENAAKIAVIPSTHLIQDLEDRDNEMVIVNFYAQNSKAVDPIISIPFYLKYEPRPLIQWSQSRPGGCLYQPTSCISLPADSALGVSVSYIDKSGQSKETRIFKLNSFLKGWNLRNSDKVDVMIYSVEEESSSK